MLDHGADGPSFETIVAAGANSAVPIHWPTAELAAAISSKIDFGAPVGGYHSDMTRTFVLAGADDDAARRSTPLVSEAQQAGVAALLRRASLADVDAAARRVIAEAGRRPLRPWAGHGVGLQIHEAPGIGSAPSVRCARARW